MGKVDDVSDRKGNRPQTKFGRRFAYPVCGLFKVLFLLGIVVLVGRTRPLGADERVASSGTSIQRDGIKRVVAPKLDGCDGPYLIKNRVIRVDSTSEVHDDLWEPGERILVVVNNLSKDQFYVVPDVAVTPPAAEYETPRRLLVISDIEGNFDALASFLVAHGVCDEQFNWTFGQGHLMLPGDFVDRGHNVTQVLWLIYRLHQQAEANGGCVHFVLGNHEIMNVQGRWRYAQDKYKLIAQKIGDSESRKANYRAVYSDESELGRWIRSRNVIEKVGRFLFVHGGISPDLLKLQLSLDEINEIVRSNIDTNLYHHPGTDERANIVMGRKGPFWFRGLVSGYKDYYGKVSHEHVRQVLTKYSCKHIVIGHTVVDDIVADFEDSVICIDVRHGERKHSRETKGLLVEKSSVYMVNAAGGRVLMLAPNRKSGEMNSLVLPHATAPNATPAPERSRLTRSWRVNTHKH